MIHPLTSTYWELTDGFGNKEKHFAYAQKSLERLKKKYPFLIQYTAYLDFLDQYGGLTLEPIEGGDSIGTFWGTGANIPHFLDDEGDSMEAPFFFFADIVDFRKDFSLAFYFDSESMSDKVFIKIIYYENFKGERKYENELHPFADNFLQFLDTVLNFYPEIITKLIGR